MLIREHFDLLPAFVCEELDKAANKYSDYLFFPIFWDEYAEVVLNWKGDILHMNMPNIEKYASWFRPSPVMRATYICKSCGIEFVDRADVYISKIRCPLCKHYVVAKSDSQAFIHDSIINDQSFTYRDIMVKCKKTGKLCPLKNMHCKACKERRS